jgi:hypothetical protein
MLSVALLTVAAGAGGARAGRPRTASACPTPDGHVLLADHRAALYTVRARRARRLERSRYVEQVIETRGCAYGGWRSFQIWEQPGIPPTEENAGIDHLVLSGTVAAYEEWLDEATRYTPEGTEVREEWHVVVRDLRSGRVLRRVPTAVAERPTWVGDGYTTAIVVKDDGAVAWIVRDGAVGQEKYEVHALDKTGERILATGADIDRDSLALARGTLYWTQGGKPYSAPLI